MLAKSETSKVREIAAVLLVTVLAQDSTKQKVDEEIEAAIQFASYRAIPPLVKMLQPANEPGTHVIAITSLHVLAQTLDECVIRALMSEELVASLMRITGMLTGRLDFDSNFEDMEMVAI